MSLLAESLIAARRSGEPYACPPEAAPASFAQAYEVQAEVAQALGAKVAGWKVGFAPDRTPFAAPIFAADLRPEGGTWQLGRHPVKIELELAIRLSRDLPAAPLDREALLDSVSAVFAGIELVEARLAAPEQAPFLARVADNFANLGYVEGTGRPDAQGLDLAQLTMRIHAAEALRQAGTGTHGEGDPLAPVLAWAAVACDRLGGLRAGQFITTGTLNTPFDLDAPTFVHGDIDGVGRASVSLVR